MDRHDAVRRRGLTRSRHRSSIERRELMCSDSARLGFGVAHLVAEERDGYVVRRAVRRRTESVARGAL